MTYTTINLNPTVTPSDWLEGRGGEQAHIQAGCDKASNSGQLPPWMKEGILFYGNGGGCDDTSAWKMHKAAVTPIVRHIADFYTLEAIATQIPQGNLYVPAFKEQRVLDLVRSGHTPVDRTNPEIISLWAMFLQARLIEQLAPLLRNYMYYACAGEASHHRFFRGYLKPCGEDGGRWWYSKIVRRFGGEAASRWLVETFYDGATISLKTGKHVGSTGWIGGWGGKKWAQCAEVLHYHETGVCGTEEFTPKNFCDRVFSLQHNGGTILSKINWHGGIGHNLNDVLNAHHAGSYPTLVASSSPVVKMLWEIAKNDMFFFTGFNWNGFDYPTYVETQPSDEYLHSSEGCPSMKGKCDSEECHWCDGCDEAKCDCECCDDCEHSPCQCCSICNGDPQECSCCHECGCEECECCPSCGSTDCGTCDCGEPGCDCGSCENCLMTNCNCKCCGECGSYPCECCSKCKSYPCDCDNEEEDE